MMQWKTDKPGGSPLEAVHGVELIEIPQFTLVEHRTITTVETLATGLQIFLGIFVNDYAKITRKHIGPYI